MPASAAAQQAQQSTGTDRALLSACLRESASSPRACIGTIVVPCVRQTPNAIRGESEVTCAKRETILWRERLDAASGTYAQALDSGQRSRFAALQRSWEGYVAQKCAFLGETQAAARMAAMQAGCDLQEVASRSIEIERGLRTRQGVATNPRNQPPRIER
ncbi:MAG: hypothetical protein ACRCWO_14065 [Bosea sp. (in: a-proteobacteria)]